MHNKWTALALTGALICAMSIPALASDKPLLIAENPAAEAPDQLKDSALFYGTVQKIMKDTDGTVKQILVSSDHLGEYIFNISPETYWIDSGNHAASSSDALTEGEGVYVFHSTVAAYSMPPQSAAFAVVRNIPQDVGCAQYHKVEAISQEKDGLKITTDNGGLFLLTDEDTGVSSYSGEEASLKDVQVGDYIMAWYGPYDAVYPSQTYAYHVMVLAEVTTTETPETPVEAEPVTRSELIVTLHEKAGKPVVNYAMNYTDVSGDAAYAEAIRWATSEKLADGYGDGRFGPDDTMTREQLVTVLWRWSGSPMLADYEGLADCKDAGDISDYAQNAFAWAHQQKLITADENGMLLPQADADTTLVNAMLEAIGQEK